MVKVAINGFNGVGEAKCPYCGVYSVTGHGECCHYMNVDGDYIVFSLQSWEQ